MKPATATAPAPHEPLSPRELKKLADELGAIDAKVASLEDLKKDGDAMRAKLRAAYADSPLEGTFSAQGKVYTCTIGAAGNERKIKSMTAVFDQVGPNRFISRCSYTLKNLDADLPASDVEQLVTTARTGPRPIKTFAKAT